MADVRADTAQYSCKISGTTFQILSLSIHEGMSALFQVNLSLWSDNAEVDVKSLLRQTAEITIKWGDKKKQYFGVVSSFSQTMAGKPGKGGVQDVYGEYVCEVVPTLWLLDQKRNCKIFQNMSADVIIKKVLDDRGMAGKYDAKMSGKPVREYCVQYRETDLDFISRLMEEEGIFYYFTHDGEEKMVLGDSAGHYGTCGPESSVEYRSESGVLPTAQEYLTALTYDANAYTGKVKYKDFDYRSPRKPLKVDKTAEKNTDVEIYDYQVERYQDDGRGRGLAGVAVEALSAMRENLSGAGSWRSASAGCKFTLAKAYRSDLEREWVIISANHMATQTGEGGVDYSSTFLAIPSGTTFRPMPHHPKPLLGKQTAFVVGPKGDKIYMDDLGRAKVQFHWDLDGKNDENSSCWIRVAQPYAGIDEQTQKKHGFQWHPLIGDEVVVDFLDGDPDNPLITGSVYNADNSPIVKPAELVRNRILTPYQHQLLMDDKNAAITLNTGGNERLYMLDKNEDDGKILVTTKGDQHFRMEDNDDNIGNAIFMRTSDNHVIQLAVKDTADGIAIITKDGHKAVLSDYHHAIKIATEKGHEMVLSDEDHEIHVKSTDGHKIVIDDNADTITMSDSSGSHSLKIDAAGSEITLETAGNLTFKVAGNFNFQLGGSYTLSVGGSQSVTVGGSASTNVGASSKLKVGGTRKETIGGSSTTSVGASLAYRVGGGCGFRTGGRYSVQAASTAKIQAAATITIQGGASVTTTAPMVTSRASGINTLQGSLVKIN